MQIQKQLIIKEVAYELQAIKKAHKELVEVQRECFRLKMKEVIEKLEQMESSQIEIEEVTEKLGQMEIKLARLKKEIGLFKVKELKLDQYLGKNMLAMKNNQHYPIRGQQKSLENPAKTIEEEDVYPIQSPKENNATFILQLSPTKNTQK